MKRTGLKHFNDTKAFIEYSNDMNDIKILKNTIQIRSILMILNLLLNTPMKWMILTKILKNTIQIRNLKY